MPSTIPARFFDSPNELRAWFRAHHQDARELWVGFYKAHTGRGGVVYPEAVDEALCFGWIDTTVRRIDDDRYANRFTPRRPGSHWSDGNLRRFDELDRSGRIHASGRRVFESRPAKPPKMFRSGRAYRFSPELATRLRGSPDADRYFRSRPRNFRKRATFWVMSAVRPATRERRFTTLLDACEQQTLPPALLLPGESAPRPVHRQSASGRR